jgi:hypothetical protein
VWKAENACVPLILPIEIASEQHSTAIIMDVSRCSVLRSSEISPERNKAPRHVETEFYAFLTSAVPEVE